MTNTSTPASIAQATAGRRPSVAPEAATISGEGVSPAASAAASGSPPGSAADEGPVYDRSAQRPAAQDALAADDPAALPRPAGGPGLRAGLLALLASPDAADKAWVTEQYDSYVRGDTVLAPPQDAGLVRIDEQTGLGIALATDGNGRYARLDPYAGAQLALAEAYRNVAATGARPLAVTNCMNFGSPEDPAVMWQFAAAVRGLADACLALGVPVTGGNVSFYNQTGGAAIHPTPVVGVLGVHDDVRQRLSIGFREAGASVLLLVDSLTRVARAQREVGLSAGEPPARHGYPPSVFALLPRLIERAGATPKGAITGLYTVLVAGNDLDEPIADEVRGLVDGHIVLDRRLAQRGHFPPIDVVSSVSRLMHRVVDPRHGDAAAHVRAQLAVYEEHRDLITLGAYQAGRDPTVDAAITAYPAIEALLRQRRDEAADWDRTLSQLGQLAGRT